MSQQNKFNVPFWVDFFATGFFIGHLRPAPGTLGTLVAVPLVYLLSFLPSVFAIFLVLLFSLFSIFVAQQYEIFSSSHDSKSVVIDEIAGFFVAMALIPMNIVTLILGFVLFRFFDILKPFPISHLDRNVKGGFGVVVDDLAAGLFVNIILQVIIRLNLGFLYV